MGYEFGNNLFRKKIIILGLLIFVFSILSFQEIITESSDSKGQSVIEIQAILDTLGDGLTEREVVENKIIADYHSHKFNPSYTDLALKNIVAFLGGGAVTCCVFLTYAAISEFSATTVGLYSPEAQYIYRNILNISAAGGALSAVIFDILEYINSGNERAKANENK